MPILAPEFAGAEKAYREWRQAASSGLEPGPQI